MTGSNWRPMGLFLFCLKDTLEKRCRDTLYLLFDCITDLCSEKISVEEVDLLEVKLNKVLPLLEMNFPTHLQNITTHILHHIPDGIRRYGPVYGTWMFVFERFNSWICKRVTNMQYPEATAIETFLLHDWCHYMLSSGRAPKSIDSLMPNLENNSDNESEETLESLHQKKKTCHLGRRDSKSLHKGCRKLLCDSCTTRKYFYHKETDLDTNRIQVYTCESRELKSARTSSSYVYREMDRGVQHQKVVSGKKKIFYGTQDFW